MANEPVTTPIHDLYAQRFAADLETNRKEQADLTAQIEELQDRLRQLRSDENWLCGVQGVLPPADAVEAAKAAPAGPGAATVPGPRRAKKSTAGAARAKKGTAGAARAKKSTAGAARAKKAAGAAVPGTEAEAAAKPAARKPDSAASPAKKPARTDEPPLRELLHALLVHAAEPRMVSEVTAELAQAHPGRTASGQVVRNTLEGLVKKGQVEKEHRQGSVMYTAVRPAAQGAASDAVAEAEAGADTATDTATAAP
ncbi:hypothetical protein GCM10010347_28400 [Streptomyces cirratus]|uniref:Regulatory protein n=1 Tax=Streptomyces cirratus TaxID=68187 RepID=A0ABQ3ESP6_9ACTN|nr:hypothetical protein [Streptomyces cirratus]GHB56624.1 hypothetical protein GCM10010347_28400 [Streptomyces cirratus]